MDDMLYCAAMDHRETAMSDNFAHPHDSPRRGNGLLFGLVVLLTLAFAGVAGLLWIQIEALRQEIADLEGQIQTARTNDTLLTQIINANQETMIEGFNKLTENVEREIVDSARGRMEDEVAQAIQRLSAFGNAGFAFQMEEFDRRSCVNGGVFSGETPDYQTTELPFEAGTMVEVLPTHGDISGIPFYRVEVDSAPIGDGSEEFRHGSMRIACN